MARSFSGTNGINIGSNASTLNITNSPFSFASWIFPTSVADGQILVLVATAHEMAELRFDRSGSNNISWLIITGTAASPVTHNLTSTSLCSNILNVWTHTAGTWDGTTQIIYLNGLSQNSVAMSGNLITGTSGSAWGIGRDNVNAGNTFLGSIADAAVWTVALTAGEVLALGTGARPYNIRPTSLKGYWPLDGLQSPEPDLSGNAFNGTVTGAALAAGPPTALFTPRWPQFGPVSALVADVLYPQIIM